MYNALVILASRSKRTPLASLALPQPVYQFPFIVAILVLFLRTPYVENFYNASYTYTILPQKVSLENRTT